MDVTYHGYLLVTQLYKEVIYSVGTISRIQLRNMPAFLHCVTAKGCPKIWT